MTEPAKIAFYDLDGTLVFSNIVTRYAFFARRLPSRALATWKLLRLIASVPTFLILDHYSRRLFNEVFFREYAGLEEEWLAEFSEALFREAVEPSIFPGTRALLEGDRAEGFHRVLVTGELDFVLAPVKRYFGLDALISNRLVFEKGRATGEVVPPLIAEEEKVRAMDRLCRALHARMPDCKAYSDSFSDVPMLEAVGRPSAVNPDRRLRKLAEVRGWPTLNLRLNREPRAGLARGDHAHIP